VSKHSENEKWLIWTIGIHQQTTILSRNNLQQSCIQTVLVILRNFIKSDTLSREHWLNLPEHHLRHLLFIENTKKWEKHKKTPNASDYPHSSLIFWYWRPPLGISKTESSHYEYMKQIFSRYFVLFELISNHLQLKVELVIKRQDLFHTVFCNFTPLHLQPNTERKDAGTTVLIFILNIKILL
jgi:hypothetical protein